MFAFLTLPLAFLVFFISFQGVTLKPKPLFKVGDCFYYTYPKESWEASPAIYKVTQVGVRSYKVKIKIEGGFYPSHYTEDFIWQKDAVKVDCPN